MYQTQIDKWVIIILCEIININIIKYHMLTEIIIYTISISHVWDINKTAISLLQTTLCKPILNILTTLLSKCISKNPMVSFLSSPEYPNEFSYSDLVPLRFVMCISTKGLKRFGHKHISVLLNLRHNWMLIQPYPLEQCFQELLGIACAKQIA